MEKGDQGGRIEHQGGTSEQEGGAITSLNKIGQKGREVEDTRHTIKPPLEFKLNPPRRGQTQGKIQYRNRRKRCETKHAGKECRGG